MISGTVEVSTQAELNQAIADKCRYVNIVKANEWIVIRNPVVEGFVPFDAPVITCLDVSSVIVCGDGNVWVRGRETDDMLVDIY